MMTDTAGTPTPAGWYPDPAGSEHLRWWDGAAWSAHLAPQPDAAPAPLLPTPVVQAPVPAPSLTPGGFASEPESPAYVPFQNSWQTSSTSSGYTLRPDEFARPAQWNSAAAWAIAASPIYFGLLGSIDAATGATLGTGTGTVSVVAIVVALFILLGLIAVLVAAVRDSATLKRWGYLNPPSALWILLGQLVYLIIRTVRVHREVRRGIAPLILFAVSSVAVSIISLAIFLAIALPAIESTAGSTYAQQFTAGVQKGLDQNGGNYAVVCPPVFPTALDSTFNCTATDENTNTPHTLEFQIVDGANGQVTQKLVAVTPAFSP
jgi:Protein of unknown function (DUF2510)